MLKSLLSGLMMAVAMAGSAAFATAPSNGAETKNKSVVWEANPISPAELGTMLKNLGYDAKVIVTGKNPVYRIVEKRPGLTAPMNVCLSPNGKVLWFDVTLMSAGVKPQGDLLFKLLSERFGKTKLIIRNEALKMWFPIDNMNITPQVVRAELNAFLTDVDRAVKIIHPKQAAPSVAKK